MVVRASVGPAPTTIVAGPTAVGGTPSACTVATLEITVPSSVLPATRVWNVTTTASPVPGCTTPGAAPGLCTGRPPTSALVPPTSGTAAPSMAVDPATYVVPAGIVSLRTVFDSGASPVANSTIRQVMVSPGSSTPPLVSTPRLVEDASGLLTCTVTAVGSSASAVRGSSLGVPISSPWAVATAWLATTVPSATSARMRASTATSTIAPGCISASAGVVAGVHVSTLPLATPPSLIAIGSSCGGSVSPIVTPCAAVPPSTRSRSV